VILGEPVNEFFACNGGVTGFPRSDLGPLMQQAVAIHQYPYSAIRKTLAFFTPKATRVAETGPGEHALRRFFPFCFKYGLKPRNQLAGNGLKPRTPGRGAKSD